MRLALLSMLATVFVAVWSVGASGQEAFEWGWDTPLVLSAQAPADGAVAADATADFLDDTTTSAVGRRTIAPQDDPYAALGIRAGGFVLFPSLTVTAGHTSNAAESSGGSGSAYVTVTPELAIRSDWAEHEATLTLRGSYERFFDGTTADKPTAMVAATGRIDLDDG